jgi:hypothetical protein
MSRPAGMPTGSRIGLAMQCVGSAVLDHIESTSEASAGGTAKHAYVEALVSGSTQEDAIASVPDDHRDACLAIDDRVAERLRGLRAEVAYALDLDVMGARELPSIAHRDYSDAKPNEIAATLDYSGIVEVDGRRVGFVYDLKTGRMDPGDASVNWQLRVGACMVECSDGACDEVRVGLVHAPEGRRARWSEAKFDALDIGGFLSDLRDLRDRIAHARSALASGALPEFRMGPHCTYCPARLACPAQVGIIRSAVADGGAMLDDIASSVSSMTSNQLSAAWQRAQPFLDAAKRLRGAFAEAAKTQPFRTSRNTEYGLRKTMRTELDGGVVYDVARDLCGVDAARAFVSFEASKASVDRGIKAARAAGLMPAGAKSRLAGITAVLNEVERRGGSRRVEASRLDEHPVEGSDE